MSALPEVADVVMDEGLEMVEDGVVKTPEVGDGRVMPVVAGGKGGGSGLVGKKGKKKGKK